MRYDFAVKLINKGYLIHCSPEIIEKFDSKFIKGGNRAKEGYGFYFSDMPYKSIDYGDNFYIVKKNKFNFLNSFDKIDMDFFFKDINKKSELEYEIYKTQNLLDNVRNIKEYDFYTKKIEELNNELEKFEKNQSFLLILQNSIKKYNPKTYGQLESYIVNPDYNIPKLIQFYIENGYDGYETEGIYTIFNIDKLNQFVKKIDLNQEISESKKNKSRVIPYESDEFEIGFESDGVLGYAHVCEEIDYESFEIKDELNSNFWKDNKLDSRIRLKLLDIADDFTDFLNVDWVKPEDITMTGSLSNYNWSEDYSDIDLHIIIDYSPGKGMCGRGIVFDVDKNSE